MGTSNTPVGPKSPHQRGAYKLPEIWEEAIDIYDFVKMDLPDRPIIITPWLRKSSLVMIYAERGIGKTWFGLSIALSIITGKSIGNWEVSETVGVLYIDGEMAADEMQERIRQLSATLPPLSAPFKLLSSDLLHQKNYASVNITALEWRKKIHDALAAQKDIAVLILDNLSCLTPGIEENDKESWDGINQWLIELRHSGIAVIFLHHAGKNKTQRGTSGREDALDIVIKLSTPPGYRTIEGAKFIVSFEKSRGVYGSGISDFTFSLGEDADGNLIWLTDAISTMNNKDRIIALLGEGKMPNGIMAIVGGSKQNISKHKKWAIDKGYLFNDGKSGQCSFTEKGREKYAVHLIDI